MGQKVNPRGFRVGPNLNNEWQSVFYGEKDYSKKLLEDLKIRDIITKKYKIAQVSRVSVKRASNKLVVDIHAKKPGVIIGKSGSDIESLKKDITNMVSMDVFINIHEIKKPATDFR